MMASVFASRVIGVFRAMAIANVGGIRADVDAYQVAFVIPEILNHAVASGFLSITFIPMFSAYLANGKVDEGNRVFSLILNTFGTFLIGLIILSMIFAPTLVHVFAPGFSDPETVRLAVRMTRIILPAQFFFFAGGLAMAVQFAHEKFFIPALAPLIYNAAIIAGGLAGGRYIGMEGFAWGVLVGAFAGNFLLQAIGARKLGLRYRLCFDIFHPDVIRYIRLTLPLMLGLTMSFSMEILLKFFGSYLSPGNISAMNYAWRVMFILVGMFGQAVGVASFPFMAKLALKNDFDQLNHLLNNTLKFMFLVIPFSVFFMVMNHEIIVFLFQRGQFDADATRLTAAVLPYFMFGAFAFSAQNIISRGFYAFSNTLFPTLVTSACVLLSLPCIFLSMKQFDAKGVAFALSAAMIIQTGVLFECWNQKSGNTGKTGVYLFFGKTVGVSFVIGAVLFFTGGLIRQFFDSSSFTGSFFILSLGGSIFLVLLFVAGYIFNISEIHILYQKLFNRIVPWKRKSV